MEAAIHSGGSSELRTFLIADIRGYTRFTLEHGDEAAARPTTAFAEITYELVVQHGGQSLAQRGDEAVAVFASARGASRAATVLQQRFKDAERKDPDLPLRVGIGLDAGEAVRVADDYRGAALNLAARLCGRAAPGEVLASEAVTHLARKLEDIGYTDRGLAELKGFSDPVRVFEIATPTASTPGDGADRPPEDTRPEQSLPFGGFLGALPVGQLVSRESELAAILDAIDAVGAGEGRLVMLAGEPGIGQTRLAQEATVIARNRGFLLGAGRCYEQQSAVAFYPFLDALAAIHAGAPASIRADPGRRWPFLGQLIPDAMQLHPVPRQVPPRISNDCFAPSQDFSRRLPSIAQWPSCWMISTGPTIPAWTCCSI